MLDGNGHIFFSRNIATPPKDLLKNHIQWLLFLRVLILTILLGISVLLQTKTHDLIIPSINVIALFIAGVYLYTILSALILKGINNYRGFALLQLVSDALLLSCIVFATGGSQSIFTLLYLFPILAGGYLLLRLGGLLMAAVCTINYGFIILVELLYQPWLWTGIDNPVENIIVAMHFFAVHGIVFFLISGLSIVIFERMWKTEKALTESTLNYDRLEILYRQVFDDITTGIITTDEEDRITSFNNASEIISGFRREEVLNKAISDLLPDLKHEIESSLRQVTELTKKDSTRIPIGYSWSKLKIPGGQGNGRVYTMQDLSRIRDMEKQVKQAEKMATIGEMAAGIAHEFRNPLAAISGATQVLQQETAQELSSHKLLDIVIRESDRLEKTIDEFLQFSKPAEPIMNWFSIRNLINETVQLLQQGARWKSRSCRTVTLVSDDLDFWADSKQVQQVLVNLISNACHALGEKGGDITVEATEETDQTGKEYAVLKVSDCGPGIKEEVLGKIYDPFFTTSENGTGLGLSIVKQIVESHNGRIEVTSVPDEQTVFKVFFPLPS
ncbi:MAG: PAS domain S-box protein [Proteobacteria bacterium]|nr:PAS domain S-box protein [Pseudomonadota bacterium]MBU1738762.1 PAS domain S-box protein [Pseudomonadota bacterium]